MIDFDSSFNMFLGTNNKELKWFDNPYIEVNVYDLDQDFQPQISKDITLRKCDREKDLLKFMKDNVADYYPNALCFDDKRQITLLSNWFDEKYKSIYISIDACTNRPGKMTKCKSIAEI